MDEQISYDKKYYWRHREKRKKESRDRMRKLYKENRHGVLQYNNEYRQKNKEKVKEWNHRAYRKRHLMESRKKRSERLEKQREYYLLHREEILEKQRRYRKENKDKVHLQRVAKYRKKILRCIMDSEFYAEYRREQRVRKAIKKNRKSQYKPRFNARIPDYRVYGDTLNDFRGEWFNEKPEKMRYAIN